MSITYKTTKSFTELQLKDLFESVQWKSAQRADKLVLAFAQSSKVISAWDDGVLVGLIRGLDDGVWQATIDCLLVNPRYQEKGIAAQLLSQLKEEYKEILYLNVVPEEKQNVSFYAKYEFEKQEDATLMQIVNKNWFA